MYQVEKDLTLSEQSWRKVEIFFLGFTAHGALRYDVLDKNDGRRLIHVYMRPWKKEVEAFQGKRSIVFHYSEGIDGSSPHYLLSKILNFLMW